MPEDQYKAIGRRLRKAREATGYSQEDVAKFLSVTGATYSRYESGHYKIAVADLYRLADFLHVSPEYLVRGRQPSPDELPDFDIYVTHKFKSNPKLLRALKLAYEAIRTVEEEGDQERRQRPDELRQETKEVEKVEEERRRKAEKDSEDGTQEPK